MTDSAVRDATRVATAQPHDFEPPGFVRQVRTMVWRSLKHIKRQPEMLTDAVTRFREADVALLDIALQRPSLDDVFLALTGHTAAPEATS